LGNHQKQHCVIYAPFRFSYLHLRTVILFFRKKEVTFAYQKLLLFLSKPQAWYIIIETHGKM